MKKEAMGTAFKKEGWGEIQSILPLNGGRINESFRVETGDKEYVVQLMNGVFNKETLVDQEIISACLPAFGFQTPELIGSWSDDWGLWKVTGYIPHNETTPLNRRNAGAAARYLSGVHAVLKRIRYRPKFTIPHFHETEYFIGKLAEYANAPFYKNLAALVAPECQSVICEYSKLPKLTAEKVIIHGDPKFNNFLFSYEGNVIALIDWDTLMLGSPIMDVGDMARSFCRDAQGVFDQQMFNNIVAGYAGNGLKYSTEEIFVALRVITLELTARFLLDYFDDYYFSWDPSKFSSRRESNLANARGCLLYWKTIRLD